MAALALDQTKIPPTQLEMSAWTPKNNRTFNIKLFQERFELIKKWYTAWSDNQKWQLIEHILLNLSDKDIIFLHSVIDPLFPPPPPSPPPPIDIREDFTRIIPRCLSLRILSYLDPRSLCRASQVSWYWRDLCQQNILWRSKCIKYGWFIPSINHTPILSDPNSLWKRHYINCVQGMFWKPPPKLHSSTPIDSSSPTQLSTDTVPLLLATHSTIPTQTIHTASVTQHSSTNAIFRQPLWKHSSRFPKDLVQTSLSNKMIIKTYSNHQKGLLSSNPTSTINTIQSLTVNNEPTDISETTSNSSEPAVSTNDVMIKNGSIPINVLIDPTLIEKMRLEEPSERSLMISTINNNEIGQSLAKRVESLQEEAPFPKLRPYYVVTSSDEQVGSSFEHEQGIENKGKEREHPPLLPFVRKNNISPSITIPGSKSVAENTKGETVTQTTLSKKNHVDSNENIELNHSACVREWTADDFDNNSSSESDIF